MTASTPPTPPQASSCTPIEEDYDNEKREFKSSTSIKNLLRITSSSLTALISNNTPRSQRNSPKSSHINDSNSFSPSPRYREIHSPKNSPLDLSSNSNSPTTSPRWVDAPSVSFFSPAHSPSENENLSPKKTISLSPKNDIKKHPIENQYTPLTRIENSFSYQIKLTWTTKNLSIFLEDVEEWGQGGVSIIYRLKNAIQTTKKSKNLIFKTIDKNKLDEHDSKTMLFVEYFNLIKVHSFFRQDERREFFQKKAYAITRIPIASIYKLGILEKEYTGGNLKIFLAGNRFTILEKIKLTFIVVEATKTLHSIDCYHGDIKLENFFMRPEANDSKSIKGFFPCLADFAEARFRGNELSSSFTPAYCFISDIDDFKAAKKSSPDMAHTIVCQMDLVALAIVIYQIFAGVKEERYIDRKKEYAFYIPYDDMRILTPSPFNYTILTAAQCPPEIIYMISGLCLQDRSLRMSIKKASKIINKTLFTHK